MPKEFPLKTDFHSHILPRMDDGAKTTQESLAMLELLKKQGVETVFLTPHYDVQNESVENFLTRREASMQSLLPVLSEKTVPQLELGAEILLRRGISKTDLFPLVTSKNTILLELPYVPFQPWMAEEIENIAYGLRVTPLLAHVERYHSFYTEENYETLFSLEHIEVQMNCNTFTNRHGRQFLKKILKRGFMPYFGTDTHNLSSRAPNFDLAQNYAKKYALTEPIL